ncbi:uncharacterized protein LOC143491127 [Brachyhypopomus gauderio]|uniref:uncharacterized protein LOC143491127 n=1 Tax=Brachyhypopomus gauderio TaxID=698409 RepID=UPI00404158DA
MLSTMFLLTSTLLLISTGLCGAQYQQVLTCPYRSEDKDLHRVWCKRDPDNHDCCMGFAFQAQNGNLDDGRLQVTDDGKAFIITVTQLSEGGGVYWCGLRNGTNTIVKLSEVQLYTPAALVWNVLRWVIFSLLLCVVAVTSLYSNRKGRKEQMSS